MFRTRQYFKRCKKSDIECSFWTISADGCWNYQLSFWHDELEFWWATRRANRWCIVRHSDGVIIAELK